MFAVIYSFKIKEGEQPAFEKYWAEATHFFRDNAGGLGSRLHNKSEQEYIAYAQWPSREMWQNARKKFPESALSVLHSMRETCEKIETNYELDVVDDFFIGKSSLIKRLLTHLHCISIFHSVVRTSLILLFWYVFPEQRFVVIPFTIDAIYLLTIWIFLKRKKEEAHTLR